MRRVTRHSVIAVFVGILTVLAVTISVSPASADALPPGLPVVNVLPSTVIGAAGRGLSSPEALVMMMKAGSVDAPVWKMVAAAQASQAAGTATSTELATLAGNAAKFAAPATRFAGLLKVAGPATLMMTALQLGLSVGDTGSRLMGFKDSMVCQENNGVLEVVSAFTNHVDCTGYRNELAKAQQDYDQAAGAVSLGELCGGTTGECVQYQNSSLWYNQSTACMTRTVGGVLDDLGRFSYPIFVHISDSGGQWIRGYYRPSRARQDGGVNCPQGLGQGTIPFIELNPQTVGHIDGWAFQGLGDQNAQQPSGGIVMGTSTKASPDRTWQCKITNTDGTSSTKFSKTFVESDPAFAVPECPQPTPGTVPSKVEIGEGTSGGPVIPVYNQPTTPEWQQTQTNYPKCSSGLCGLELTPTATPGTTCHALPSACEGWFKDPSKESNYKCTYGTYDVPLAECTTYAPTFEPSAPTTGLTLGDPETGATGGVTTSNGDPAPGVNSNGQCFPKGWAVFNPIEWVLHPVVCAFQAAFIPSPAAVQKAADDADTRWKSSTPGKVVGAIAALTAMTLPSSGCDGIAVPFPVFDMAGHMQVQTQHFLPACPGDFFAPWAPLFSVFIGGSFAIAGIFSLKRLIAAFVGLNAGD